MGHRDPRTPPSPWITRHAAALPRGSRVLDVACGAGRHTRWFLDRGHRVTAIDADLSGVADLLDRTELRRIACDLEDGGPWPLAGETFDAVVVTNYLHRPLFPALLAAVAPGGWLLYETFAAGNERYGKPRSPDHLLQPDELLRMVEQPPGLRVEAFFQGFTETPRPAVVQRIAACRGR